MEVIKNGKLIPQRCVTEFQGKYFVYTVDKNNIVHKKNVELGVTYKDYWVVESGLESGDQIVFEGLQKVKEGLTIHPETVNNLSNLATK